MKSIAVRRSEKSPAETAPALHVTRLRPFRSSLSEATGHSLAAARRRAARSRSITARQPGLTCARSLTMQAVIRWTLGTSRPHSRMASPVHICCASERRRGWTYGKRGGREGDGEEKGDPACTMESHRCVPQGCARCWPLFVGGAARGLRCRTRHPSPGSPRCGCSNSDDVRIKSAAPPYHELCANVLKLQWLASTLP